MKNSYLTLFFTISLAISAFSQNLLTEDFVYDPVDSLEETRNWHRSGVNFLNNVTVVAPGLEYVDYVGSGRGNSCRITNDGDGDILLRNFPTAVISGSVYLSFMFRIDSMPATVTQGYFICLNPNTGGTYLNTALYIKRLSSTEFNVGVRKTSPVNYSNKVFETGKTYLGVLKYAIHNGVNDDSSSVFVFENGVPTTEPSQVLAASTDGDDFTGQATVVLTNNYAQTGMKGVDVQVDGIRAGTSWETSVLAMISSVENEKLRATFYIRNAPNPFAQNTTIEYQIPNRGFVNLKMMDASGKPCAELVNEMKEGGKHTLDYNATGLPAGVYTCKLLWNGLAVSDQMILVK
ncbi:MAG: hypothetical protein IPM92_04380 [Saprospiraceae bacterium]|nr:hypothetical protein [Saprospiraceae bacterium]